MPVDFGSDLACVADFSDECREVTGTRLLAEALARRLTTPRGMLIDDPDFGTDLHDYLGLEYTTRNAARLLADVRAECLKDERVIGVTPTIKTFAGRTISLEIAVEIADAVFVLTLKVSDVTVELLTP